MKLRRHRILVIKNRAIGDTILLTGSLRLLRKAYPNHKIHVLVRSPAGELLEGLPYVDRVLSVAEPPEKIERFAHWMRLIRRLREKRYDMVLNFHASFRTSLTAKFLRTAKCVANHHELRGRNWFSDVRVPGRGEVKSIIDRDLDVLRAIGIKCEVADALPELHLSPAEHKQADLLFENESGAFKGPRVFLGIGGSRDTKRWTPEHFVGLARKMAVDFDARFVLATIKSDEPWLKQFLPLVENDPAFKGRLRHFSDQQLRQTAKIISRCDAYIGNDSGLKHLAAAIGIRTFTFFGPEAPLEWHPYDFKRHPYAFIEGLNCRTETGKHWCPIDVCDRHDQQCMRKITPDAIWSDVSDVLRPRDAH